VELLGDINRVFEAIARSRPCGYLPLGPRTATRLLNVRPPSPDNRHARIQQSPQVSADDGRPPLETEDLQPQLTNQL
jgi:hypothetical protein